MYAYEGLMNQSLKSYILLLPTFYWAGFVSLLESTLRDPRKCRFTLCHNGKEIIAQSPQHSPGSCFFNWKSGTNNICPSCPPRHCEDKRRPSVGLGLQIAEQ